MVRDGINDILDVFDWFYVRDMLFELTNALPSMSQLKSLDVKSLKFEEICLKLSI